MTAPTPAGDAWQPIETAPRGGAPILLWVAGDSQSAITGTIDSAFDVTAQELAESPLCFQGDPITHWAFLNPPEKEKGHE